MGVLVMAALVGHPAPAARPAVFDLTVRHPGAADLARAFADGVRLADERARRTPPRLERWDAGPPVLNGEVVIAADPRTGTVFVKCHPADAQLVAGWVAAFDRAYPRLGAGAAAGR